MNSEILKRVVRAIADGSQGDLEQLAQTIVKSERQIGHTYVIVTALDKLPSLLLHGCREHGADFVMSIARREFISRFT